MKHQKSIMGTQMDMLHGPLLKKILLFTIPLAISGVLQQMFNSADVAVVGRFAGSTAQAAVGCNTSLIALLIGLFTGLAVGANAEIAACIGRGDNDAVRAAVSTVIVLSLASGAFLLIFGIAVARPLLQLMQTPSDVLDQAVLYLRIYFVGVPFVMLYNFGAAILRSKGDTGRPTAALLLAGVINLGLNLLFVIVFHMGVAGVAWGTSISNAVSGLLVLYWLRREEDPFRVSSKSLTVSRRSLSQIVRIGVPAGIQGMVFSLSNVCIQSAVNTLGATVVAASADVVTLELYSYYIISAFVQAAVTFTSQNYAAGMYRRVRRILWLCMACSAIATAATGITLLTLSRPVLHLFTTEEDVIAYGIQRMRQVLILQFIACSYECSASALRGIGVSLTPAIISIVGTCCLRLLWVWTVFPLTHTFGLLLAVYPTSWVVTGTSMVTALLLNWRKMPREDRVGESA